MKSKETANARLILMHVADKAETPEDRRQNYLGTSRALKNSQSKVHKRIYKLMGGS